MHKHSTYANYFMCIQEEVVSGEETHVSVIEKETGKILSGEDAPLSSNLKEWLAMNPGYVTYCIKPFFMTLD